MSFDAIRRDYCCWLAQKGAVILAIAAFLSATATINHAAEPLASIDRIQIGFAGDYKVGFWTPVEITLTGGAKATTADLETVVPDGDGIPTRTIEHDIHLEPNKTTKVRTYVKFGRAISSVTVAVHGSDGSMRSVERTFSGDAVPPALGATRRLILELGGKLDFGSVARLNEEGQPDQATIAAVDDPTAMPDQWFGYEGIDTAVLTTADSEFYRRIPPASLAAMRRWVSLGGRLLLSVGSHGNALLSPGAPLADFAPGEFEKTVYMDRFGALETFAGASQRITEQPTVSGRMTLPVAQLSKIRGRIEAFEGSGTDRVPLVVRSADGFGELIFIAVDLNQPPLNRWPALPQLLAALLGRSATSAQQAPATSAALSHLGYDDLSGQLRAGLDQFPNVRMTPFWLIAVLAAGYALLLFPADYWLRRQMKGSALWSWVSFAAIIVGVSLGVWWLGSRSSSDRLQVDQAEVVDVDVQTGRIRGSTWFSVYSPTSQEYAMALKPLLHGSQGESTGVHLSWLGLPGNALGGMGDGAGAGGAKGINAGEATAELPLFTQPYSISPTAGSIGPVPIAAHSSKCFTAEWTGSSAGLLQADLHEQAGHQLIGAVRLTNATNLQLSNCVLFYDRWAYLTAKFSAAEPIDVDPLEATSETADTYFTRRRLVGQQDVTTPYDRAGLDRARVLEIMMFYRAAGGLPYVGLLNRYQHYLDLSGQLGMDRAILIGFGPPASELTIDGEPIAAADAAEHLTIYRFVLPVRPADSNQSGHAGTAP